MRYLRGELNQAVQSKSAVIWAGAGIAASLSAGHQAATWIGLLELALERTVNVGRLSPAEAAPLRDALHRDTAGILRVATVLERELRESGEWEHFWFDFQRMLALRNDAVATAIAQLGCPIVTTNYDDLIEQATGHASANWIRPAQVERALRGDVNDVVHVHGSVNQPDTIVLGHDSYLKYLDDERAMTTLRALQIFKSHVYVGYGAGLDDPFFVTHRAWMLARFPNTAARHFRLCRESEVDALRRHHRDDRVSVLPYGTHHRDLVPFLEALAPRPVIRRRAQMAKVAGLVALLGLSAPTGILDGAQVAIEGRVFAGPHVVGHVVVHWPGSDSPWPVNGEGAFRGVAPPALGVGPVIVGFGAERIPIAVDLPRAARKVSVTLDLQSGSAIVNAR